MPADSEQVTIDQSHDKRVYTMASTTERDKWMRVFPDPMPPGHRLAYRWDDMRLEVYPEKVPDGQPGSTPHDPRDSDDEFAKLSMADLATVAAELGITFPRKTSRAAAVAQIRQKRAELNSTLSV